MYGEMKIALRKLYKTFPTMNNRIEFSLDYNYKWGWKEEYTLWIEATKHYETFDTIEELEAEVDKVIKDYDREYKESLGNL